MQLRYELNGFSSQVVYVTATVPYIFLTILLIRGLLLPGSAAGIRFYIMPNFKRLLQLKVISQYSKYVKTRAELDICL